MSQKPKSTTTIIIELIIGLILGGFIFCCLLKNTPNLEERKKELYKKGYNEDQVDSIIKKEEKDLTYAMLHLAG